MKPSIERFGKELIKKSKYSKFQDFHNLMRFRIRDILLVSSLYDSYIFEEDNRLYELIRQEYQGLNLSHSPELIQCSNGFDAIEQAKEENRFNLIIITQHIEEMSAIAFAKKAREAGIKTPIVLLGYDNREMTDLLTNPEVSIFDKVFIWQGDYRIVLGIIKYLEDRLNIEYDTKNVGVQVIILIEDNVRFYSSYLPLIYTEVLQQSQSLISEGINLSHKFLRMRARPKIILCSTYEEAWTYYEQYEENVLGIISDVDFSHNGVQDPEAGIKFTHEVKKRQPDIPILLQSNVADNEKKAHATEAAFLLKDSPTLLRDLGKFMKANFSFGHFIFRDEEGNEVGRARNLAELEDQLKIVPDESIIFHASRNHFSNWLKARTEFWLAHQLRPKKVTDFTSTDELRNTLLSSVGDFIQSRNRGVILDFNKDTFDTSFTFARIGGGSIGGKARGLGFVNNLLSNIDVKSKFKDIDINVPSSVVIATDVYDQFLDDNDLKENALRSIDDEAIKQMFVEAPIFPQAAVDELSNLLDLFTEPLAIRSSSLLEDSQGQPFAGVYDTLMIPNSHPDKKVRLIQLINVIKEVYASIFYQKAKEYIKVTSYRLEEEKMAVIIQQMIGIKHGDKYYPDFSGVAKSYNFYPKAPLKSTDGIVGVALGLGNIITEGGHSVRFCPKYPHHMMQFATISDTLKYSQQDFYALVLKDWDDKTVLTEDILLNRYPIDVADKDGVLSMVGSTYSKENDIIYDGTARPGTKLFTLSPILKYRSFPLPEILELLLELGSWGMGSPVEIEFAVNLSLPPGELKKFALLQMRPLVINNELEELDVNGHDDEILVCKSDNVLGNGIVDDIRNIVFVDKEKFERSKSKDVSLEISQHNSKLVSQGKPYLLIGVGRWGTLDPWLGIPIKWEQISGARAIIESNFRDFNVTPSQGSHFFQNLTSFKVGYFTVNDYESQGFIDWDWLNKQKTIENKTYTRHVELENPITIKINGHENRGVILKPN